MTQIVQLDFDDLQAVIKSCVRESLEEIKRLPEISIKDDRCTLLEAMEITGLKESTIYSKTMKGTIPCTKFGKRLVFSRKELASWLEENTFRKQSPEEITTQHLAQVARKKLK